MARMDTDYKYDDLDVDKKPRVIVKKKGGWLGRIIALLLGIVIGIVAGLGGLVGAGYYIVTQMKIKDATNTVTSLSGIQIPLSDYLSDEAADKTVLGLIGSITDAATKISGGTGTLGDLNAISPFVGTLLKQKVIDLLASYGIETTAEELMSKILIKKTATQSYDDRYLADFLLIKLDAVPFAELIQKLGFQGSDIITTLCYGVEGVDYEIQDGKYVMLGDSKALTVGGFMGAELDERIEKLPLDAIMGTPEDEIMLSLFYGAEHRYKKTGSDVKMNQVFYTSDGTNFYNDNGEALDLGNIAPIPEMENCYLLTFKDGSQQIVKLGEEDKYLAYTMEKMPRPVLFPKTTIGDLEGEAENLINGITLAAALNVDDDSHPILKSIAEDKNGEKRTIKDLREQGSDLINDVHLSDVISDADHDDTIVMYLLYGKKDVHYSVGSDDEIILLQKRVALYGNNVYNEYGELIEGATPNGTTSYTYDGTTYVLEEDESLGTIKVKVTQDGETTKKDATLYYVQDLYYEPTTIGDMQNAEVLSNLTGRLQLKDVMDVEDNTILKHLGEETIDDLPAAINELTIDDVFGDHFYYRTYNPSTGKYVSYREDGNHQPIDEEGDPVTGAYMVDIKNRSVDYNGDGIITREEADNALTGTWKYLRMDRTTNKIHHDYKITKMDEMMDYMSENVQAATVRELKIDGIVKNLDDDTLDKVILGEVPTLTGTKEVIINQNGVNVRVDNLDGDLTDEDHVGDLTVEQLMLYMGAMLDIFSA